MKFAGIIAEYDPFHNGHAWQLAQAKALGAERVAVAMSCGIAPKGFPWKSMSRPATTTLTPPQNDTYSRT